MPLCMQILDCAGNCSDATFYCIDGPILSPVICHHAAVQRKHTPHAMVGGQWLAGQCERSKNSSYLPPGRTLNCHWVSLDPHQLLCYCKSKETKKAGWAGRIGSWHNPLLLRFTSPDRLTILQRHEWYTVHCATWRCITFHSCHPVFPLATGKIKSIHYVITFMSL